VLCAVFIAVQWGVVSTHADSDPLIVPHAALVVIGADDTRMLVVDLGMATSFRETWELPLTVQATVLDSSPLPLVVQQLMLPTNNCNLLTKTGSCAGMSHGCVVL
jgi:hypothetical protein